MNGIRFHTKDLGKYRQTQNSGVAVNGEHRSKPIDFYGVVIDILQLRYMGWRHVYLFKCDWFDIGDGKRGIRVGDHLTSVNTSRKWYTNEPFALACQASQVFYLKDTSLGGNWFVVQKVTNRNMYDVPSGPTVNDEDHDEGLFENDAFQENEPSYVEVESQYDDVGTMNPLHRSDVEPVHVADVTILSNPISDHDYSTFGNEEDFIDEEENEYNEKNSGSSEEDLQTDFGTSSDDGGP